MRKVVEVICFLFVIISLQRTAFVAFCNALVVSRRAFSLLVSCGRTVSRLLLHSRPIIFPVEENDDHAATKAQIVAGTCDTTRYRYDR